MAWDDIGEGRYGGDAPADAYGGASKRAATLFTRAIGRKPRLAELVDALDRTAPRGESERFDALARACEGEEPSRPTTKNLETGELVSIPYAEGRAVVALVLFGEERKDGPRYGPCVVPLDLEVDTTIDLDRARTACWLTLPFHPGSRASYARLGRVALEPDAAWLPCFGWYQRPGSRGLSAERFAGYERVILDYFGARTPVDAAHEARVVRSAIGGSPVTSIRAARGMHRDLPWSSLALPPDAPRAPLAHLPPFEAPAKKRARKARAPRAPSAEDLEALLALFRAAAAECNEEWRDRWERPPDREELAHALWSVLRAAPDDYVDDFGRVAAIAPPRMVGRPTRASAELGPGAIVLEWRRHGEVESVVVSGPEGARWSAFPYREAGTTYVDVTRSGPRTAEIVRVHVIPAWRARGADVPSGTVVVRPMDWGPPARIEV